VLKRFHVNVAVTDLAKSIKFYSVLFGESPTVIKDDYAKWMLVDPVVNFSLSESQQQSGINHVGMQAETTDELVAIQKRLRRAGQDTFDQSKTECCYAKSSKSWVRDPDNVAWESFVTHDDLSYYGADHDPQNSSAVANTGRCCDSTSVGACCE
jgi:predicted lactoylglutathione lyase